MRLFIFGSTGDLVKRKIIPAFVALKDERVEIIALGRKEFTDEMYHKYICDGDCFGDFKLKPKYHKVNFEGELKCEKCDDYLQKDEENYFYSALPPKSAPTLFRYLGVVKKRGFRMSALIEKPFGSSLTEAEKLSEIAARQNLLNDIYVSDHYLFKDGVLALKARPFKNLKIVSLEKVGLEKRGSYNETGALKDMIQSHFLNITFKLLDNPKIEFDDFEISSFTRGQYGNGKDEGFVKDLGENSPTETFVRLKLKTKDKNFEFITGKKFSEKISYIEIDGEKISLETGTNPYLKLFADFFIKKRENFSTIANSLLAWQLIDKIEKSAQDLIYYPEYADANKVINDEVLI